MRPAPTEKKAENIDTWTVTNTCCDATNILSAKCLRSCPRLEEMVSPVHRKKKQRHAQRVTCA